MLAESAAASAFIASASGPSSRLTLRASIGLRRMGPVVDRHRDEGRPAGRLHRHVIGARDRRRHVFGPRRLDREFDIGPRKFRGALGIEKGLQRQDRARLLARGDHQRRLVAVRGVDVAERVADAGGRMQIDKTGVAGGLRVAVGHADDGGFLQAQHIVDIVGPVAEERQFGRAGIAEHFLDAERAQQVERGVLDGDGCAGGFCGLAGQRHVPQVMPSFRDAMRKHQTRNLEILRCAIAHRSSMLRFASE